MDLYESVRKAKKNNDQSSIQHIIDRLDPKIKQTIVSMGKEYREDVEQEVKLRIMEAVRTYDMDHLPELKEFLAKSKDGRAILARMNDDNL